MTRKSILLGLGAIGALALASAANAQIVGGGVTGQGAAAGHVAAPIPATPAVPAKPAVPAIRAPATPAIPATPAVPATPSAATAGADVSATTSVPATFAVGTVVRNSAGLQLGTVMETDAATKSSGRIAIKTSTGFITIPANSLSMQGDVAVSAEPSADAAKPKSE